MAVSVISRSLSYSFSVDSSLSQTFMRINQNEGAWSLNIRPLTASSRDALLGYLRCSAVRPQGFISTQLLTLLLKLSGTSPAGTSVKGKDTKQIRTVDLATSTKSCCWIWASWLCVSCLTLQAAAQAVRWIEFRPPGHLVKGGCNHWEKLNVRPQLW